MATKWTAKRQIPTTAVIDQIYEPIPDISPQEEEELQRRNDENEPLQPRRPRPAIIAASENIWKVFVVSFALGCFFFGAYISCFYIRSMIENQINAWDNVNPGMYHEGRWDSNWLGLGIHFVGGGYMMVFGPFQFVKSIRRKFMFLHRWNGRFTILGSFLTALGGMYYVSVSGMTLVKILGKKANYTNIAFGLSMLICGCQTYRHAAWTKRIDQHMLWAYRLAGLCFGNIFLRIYLLLVDRYMDPDGIATRIAYDIIAYTFFFPFVLLAGEIWRREQEQQQDEKKAPPSFGAVTLVVLLLFSFMVGLFLQVLWNWLPFINFDTLDQQDDEDL